MSGVFWVSVLFSEPKIPQAGSTSDATRCISFQCSSASRKFLNRRSAALSGASLSFSALQRAENSSILRLWFAALLNERFSALQRAENSSTRWASSARSPRRGFSALQRAENSSTPAGGYGDEGQQVSVLFSEPKIPQDCGMIVVGYVSDVSVLFSEPKIPQVRSRARSTLTSRCFSALQRAENSSISQRSTRCCWRCVSVLFSEPKIPQLRRDV